MVNYNTFNVTIGDKDYTRHVPFPLKWQEALDETLDYSRINLKQLKTPVFTPFTPITITMTDKKGHVKELNQFISTDSATEKPVGSGKYNHDMYQIEQTKLLEGIVVDALTFTNDLGRLYTDGAPMSVPNESGNTTNYLKLTPPDYYKAVVLKDTEFTFESIKSVLHNMWSSGERDFISGSITVKNDETPIFERNSRDNSDWLTANFTTIVTSEVYSVEYKVNYATEGGGLTDTKVVYTFGIVTDYYPLPKWNITSVINRILNLAEPHLQGETPRFYLNSEQAEQFSRIDAFDFIDTPEFMLPSGTLKEDLDIIGGYIHGIPRLNGNEVSFDMLGDTEQALLYKKNFPYCLNTFTQDIESYCSSLDSTVDNFACLLDDEQGTVTEPYNDGYKTVRTETVYARIDENNMYIATSMPIQEIKSVKCGFIPGQNFKGGDITNYIFEESEYSRLSSYNKIYSSSKAYALYYTQGSKNIYGLNFKVPTLVNPSLENYAIVNILKATAGGDIKKLGENYPLLAFQVSYIPVFRARVQQSKQYIGDITQPRALCYNQGSNLVETRYYGEHLKGTVARMGTVDRVMLFHFDDFRLIPKLGQMWGDDYFISEIACELFPEFLKCQITLSKDFNRLSQYIGINSVKRFYEVSEKQAYARDMKYADYVVIGDKVDEDTTLAGADAIAQTFSQSEGAHSVSHVIAKGVTKMGEGADGATVLLPVISVALGTAMTFTFAYEDNYSAGAQSIHETEGKATGFFTNGVAYGSHYGRFDGLKFSMYTEQSAPATPDEQNNIGNALPQWKGELPSDAVISTPENRGLEVDKNGAEVLSLAYVLEFVTNRKNYIIGAALARNCPLVRGSDSSRAAALYVLPNRMSKFAARVSLSGAVKVADYAGGSNMTVSGKSIKLADAVPESDGAAWVVATSTGEVLFGANEVVTAGQAINMPYLTLRHDIYNIKGGKQN